MIETHWPLRRDDGADAVAAICVFLFLFRFLVSNRILVLRLDCSLSLSHTYVSTRKKCQSILLDGFFSQ